MSRTSWWDQGRGSLWEAVQGGGNGGTRASGGEVEEGKPSHRWGTSPDLTIHICHCPTTDHCATLLLLLLYHNTHTQCCPAEARVGQELVFAGCSLGGVVGSGSGHSLDKWQQPNTSAPPPPPETTHQLRPNLGKDLAEEKSNLILEIFWKGFAFFQNKET